MLLLGCRGPTTADSGVQADADTDADTDTDTDTDVDFTVCADGSAPFEDVQAAVDASEDGDTIRVCAGVYGGVDVGSRQLTLVGESAANTVLFESSGTAFRAAAGRVELRGFTLRSSNTEPVGAALHLAGTEALIEDVRMTDCSPYILIFQDEGDVEYDGVVIENVTAQDDGVGFYLLGPGSAIVRHLHYQDSSVQEPLYFSNVDLEFENNVITGLEFGRLATFDDAGRDMNVVNNVFHGSAVRDGTLGALIHKGSSTDFVNNIVTANTAAGNLFSGSFAGHYNLDWGNDLGSDSSFAGEGNLSVDPWFADPDAEDFSLTPGTSPCIDAGDPSLADTDGSRSDMGAFGGPGGAW